MAEDQQLREEVEAQRESCSKYNERLLHHIYLMLKRCVWLADQGLYSDRRRRCQRLVSLLLHCNGTTFSDVFSQV
jgi:hypothetical protein